MTIFLLVCDLLLALGFTLRLVRLVISDDLGLWLIHEPLLPWARRGGGAASWRGKVYEGLSCPWCVGFWLGALVLLSLFIAGGPGLAGRHDTLLVVWRWVAGAFTLNYIAAHLGSVLGDND